MLKAEVDQGKLPPVTERLPKTPMIVNPTNTLGIYGGTWHMAQRNKRDHALFIRNIGYEPLLRWTPQWTGTIPNVALSFTSSPDAKEFLVRLRPGMRWSDGAPFTADDILFWYQDILKNPAFSSYIPEWLSSSGKLVEVTKLDTYSVSFKFSASYGLFPSFLARPEGVEPISYPAHFLKKFLPHYNPQADKEARSLGFTGWKARFIAVFGKPGTIDAPSRWATPNIPTLNAWVLTGIYGKDDPLIATRNPYFWKIDPAGQQLPYIDKVSFKLVKDKDEITKAAIDGQIDMQERSIGPSADEILAKNPNLRPFTMIEGDMNVLTLSLNLNDKDPALQKVFRNKDFRIALSLAINRQAIIDRFIPGATPFQAAPRPESPLYTKRLATQYTDYNPALARKHLIDGGLTKYDKDGFLLRPDGQRLSFSIDTEGSQRVEILDEIVKYWREIGIDVTSRNLPRDQFFLERNLNLHDASAWGGDGGLDAMVTPFNYLPISPESSWYATQWARWYITPESRSAQKPPIEVISQLRIYDKLKATIDPQRQDELMSEILDISANEFYIMGIALPPNRKGIVAKNFHNVPRVMPGAWSFATPAPTNPCQYYITPDE